MFVLFTFPPGNICTENSTLEGVECHLFHVRSASAFALAVVVAVALAVDPAVAVP
jgi:hypothetical protein